jgi:hypothetical protein
VPFIVFTGSVCPPPFFVIFSPLILVQFLIHHLFIAPLLSTIIRICVREWRYNTLHSWPRPSKVLLVLCRIRETAQASELHSVPWRRRNVWPC